MNDAQLHFPDRQDWTEMRGSQAFPPTTEVNAVPAMTEELRLRLHGSQGQESAARAEARRLARELAVARRVLAFSCASGTSARTPLERPPAAGEIPRVRASPLKARVLFSLDSCQDTGTHVALAGWAFLPVSTWNGLAATVTIIFRHGDEAYAAGTGRVFRPDVAAHFGAEPAEAAGGARGLASVGFASEVIRDSLPQGIDLEIVLRLECAGLACEQPTGRLVRL